MCTRHAEARQEAQGLDDFWHCLVPSTPVSITLTTNTNKEVENFQSSRIVHEDFWMYHDSFPLVHQFLFLSRMLERFYV